MGWIPSGCVNNLPIQNGEPREIGKHTKIFWKSNNSLAYPAIQDILPWHNSTQITNQTFAPQLEHFIMDFHYFITIWCSHEWIHKICYSWQFKLYLLVTPLNHFTPLCIYYKKSMVSKLVLLNDPKICSFEKKNPFFLSKKTKVTPENPTLQEQSLTVI